MECMPNLICPKQAIEAFPRSDKTFAARARPGSGKKWVSGGNAGIVMRGSLLHDSGKTRRARVVTRVYEQPAAVSSVDAMNQFCLCQTHHHGVLRCLSFPQPVSSVCASPVCAFSVCPSSDVFRGLTVACRWDLSVLLSNLFSSHVA
jgi:hypothetical protein